MRRTLVFLALAAGLAACGDATPSNGKGSGSGAGSAPGSATGSASGSATDVPVPAGLPANLLLAAKPDGAKDVFDAKQAAKEGDTIVIRGKIGGSKDPFVDGRAVFTLADPTKIIECSKREGDTCTTPEDY